MASKSQKLAENLAYYVGQDKRCKKETTGGCYYSGKTVNKDTDGCFVGRLLTPKMRDLADNKGIGDVYNLIRHAKEFGIKLPKLVSENPGLMRDFQSLHDNKTYWDGLFLSDEGKNWLDSIIKNHKLVRKHFEKFL